MVNNYSFNLDNDVLEHGAIGAHYSKNWSRQKQNEYNRWYYQTHKAEIARSKKKVTDAVSDARDAEKKEHWAARSMGTTEKRLMSEGKALGDAAGRLNAYEYDKRKTQWSKGVYRLHEEKSQKYIQANIARKHADKNVDEQVTRHKNVIAKSKSSVANMIAFDVSRNVSKATKAISKTLKNIKNKIIK